LAASSGASRRQRSRGAQALSRTAAERFWDLLSAPNWNVRHLYLDTAWNGVVAAGIGSFLGVFLVRLGASSYYVGLLSSLPALISVIFAVPVSAYVARQPDLVAFVTRARVALRICYLLVALAPLLLPFDQAILVIVAIWGLSALPSVALSPGWWAVVALIVPPRLRPYVNGNRWAALSITTAIAVGLFGKLLDLLPFPTNYQVVFIASFLAGMVSVYHFSRIHLTASTGPPESGALDLLRAMADLWVSLNASRPFARFIAASAVYRLGTNVPAALFAIYWVQNLQASNTLIGLRATAANAVLVLGYVAWGRVAGRWGPRWVLLACGVGTSLYPVLTSLVQSPPWLIPVAIAWGAFAAGMDVSFFECVVRSCGVERLPSFSAINNTTANVAAFFGPLIGALLADSLGIQAAFVIAGATGLVGVVLFYALRVGVEAGTTSVAEARIETRVM